MQAIVETLFDTIYLITVITLGIIMIRKSNGRKQYRLFGIMAVVLGLGDSFHLVPRALALCTTGLKLYGRSRYRQAHHFYYNDYFLHSSVLCVEKSLSHFWENGITISVYFLSALRIILCLFPQNGWLQANPPLSWGIYRNIPFVLFGLLIIALFYQEAKRQHDTAFQYMWLTIVLSFGFIFRLYSGQTQFP